jgi:GNAT superfamily N-acetyltransferase
MESKPKIKLAFSSLPKSRWSNFETLFGERGACRGCWCMSWRLNHAEFEKQKGAGNKRAMKKLVEEKKQIGIIAYLDGEPIGWCSVAPREKFIQLESSRVLKPIDDKPVWSITCFFLAKDYRRRGLSVDILKGVIAFCKMRCVKILEAYPIIPYSKNMPAPFAWTVFFLLSRRLALKLQSDGLKQDLL